jgi:hypothetical protein
VWEMWDVALWVGGRSRGSGPRRSEVESGV